MSTLYPLGPAAVPEALTAPSAAYRRHAWLALLGLFTFVLAYFALMAWFGWSAFRLLASLGEGVEDALFAGIAGVCCLFLAVFMAKALIFNKRSGAIEDMELKPAAEPELFAFLHRLADDAGAPRPHRVFLSPRVNAGVFYDLTLLNLILPSRKNLEIGMGLVNVLDLGEFKAVLAHEFGHFAQKTMAVGRWVYTAQQVAAHIVAKRDMLDSFLQGLSRVDIRIAWVGWLLSLIVWSIRSLVEVLFRIVVLSERALSREMEYQADLVAASLAGSDALVSALHKLQGADEAWSATLGFAQEEAVAGHPVKDLFAIQTRVLEHLRRIHNDPTFGASPQLQGDPAAHRVFKKALAAPPQMWSTHPASSDREDNLKRRYVAAQPDPRPAGTLFRDLRAVQEQLSTSMLKNAKDLTFAPIEESLQRLDQKYQSCAFDRRYRGMFLGRPLARDIEQPGQIYGPVSPGQNFAAGVAGLYSEAAAQDKEELESLRQERAILDATRAGHLKVSGGSVEWRGEKVDRRRLPALISQCDREIEALAVRLRHHDTQARSLHLGMATALGNGWDALLKGEFSVVHYAEHVTASLRDLQGMLDDRYRQVIADGKVSEDEFNLLLNDATRLYRCYDDVHTQAERLVLDPHVSSRLGSAWSEMLADGRLPPPSRDNMSSWISNIDGWVEALCGSLSRLRFAALEAMLVNEDAVAAMHQMGTAASPAPPPCSVPSGYPVLLAGRERKREVKLSWWDKFQSSTGVAPTAARVATGGAIIGAALYLGGSLGAQVLNIQNGLERDVIVEVDGQRAEVAAGRNTTLKLSGHGAHTVVTRTTDGETIESFTSDALHGAAHVIYNVAGASPLVRYEVLYGPAGAAPGDGPAPQLIGAPRWSAANADVVFSEPPQSIDSRSGNSRSVLIAIGDGPYRMLGALEDPKAAEAVALAHARWDPAGSRHLVEWMSAAGSDPTKVAAIIDARLRKNPEEIATRRLRQDVLEGAAHDKACSEDAAASQAKPDSSSLRYLAIRCMPDGPAQDAAFLEAYARWPKDPYLATASGYSLAGQKEWQRAAAAMQQGLDSGQVGDYIALELARVYRVTRDGKLVDLAKSHPLVAGYLQPAEASASDPYGLLQAGQLQEAINAAASPQARRADITRMAAASDGASPAMLKQAIALGEQFPTQESLWFTWVMAQRSGQSQSGMLKALLAADTQNGPRLQKFLEALAQGSSPEAAEKLLEGVSPRARGVGLTAARVLLQGKTPVRWVTEGEALLFDSERPYFAPRG